MAYNATIASCDSWFGPLVYDCNGRFDFTLLFEQSILTIAPSAALLLAAPVRIHHVHKQSRKLRPSGSWSPLVTLKILALAAFAALQLTLLVLWARLPAKSAAVTSSASHAVSVAAATLGLLDAVALGALSFLEHTRSIRPSSIICLYLLFSVLFDVAQCRTLWLLSASGDAPQSTSTTLAGVFTTMMISKALAFSLEMQDKRAMLLAALQSLGPESTAGVIGRSFFWWLNDMMVRGYRTSLSQMTLYDIDDDLRAEPLLRRARHYQGRQRRKLHATGGTPSKYDLVFLVLRSTRSALLVGLFPRVLLIAFRMSQPFLISRTILYIGGDQGSAQDDIGYGLIAATGVIYLGTAVATGFYQHKLFRAVTMVRGLLISMICSATLDLHSSSAASAGSSTLTLTSSDVDKICQSFESVHELWANPVEIVIAIWLLERQLGLGCIGPAFAVIVCTFGMTRLSKKMGPAMMAWMKGIQKRVSVTSGVISSIKEAKMLGTSAIWLDTIQDLRVQELELSKKFRLLIVGMNLIGNTPTPLAPVITFGIALLSRGHAGGAAQSGLTVSTVFTSLAIIDLVVGPLARLLFAVPSFASSIGCFERIQDFVSQAERQGPLHEAEALLTPTSTSTSDRRGRENVTIELSKVPETSQSMIDIQNISVSVKPKENGEVPKTILQDINLRIIPSTLTIVAGKSGSGKTTLLKCLLGDLEPTTGSLKTSSTGAAYCAQTTWLVNSSIKDNITAQSVLDSEWYDTVVTACDLQKDFNQLPARDMTIVGTKGLSLSGGQKQRVALARAIYSRKPLIVADDVLSGLDQTTQRHVWDRVFGPTGLLRRQKSTVILATHFLDRLGQADHVVVLEHDGRVACQGAFAEVKDCAYLKEHQEALAQDSNSEDDTKKDSSAKPTQKGSKRTPQHSTEHSGTDEEQDLLRSGGDTRLYMYYLRSIGWRYGLTALGLGLVGTFFKIFPAIWLKLWTEANADDQANTARYYGVFVAISIGGLLALAVDIWFMFVKIVPKSSENLHWTLLRIVINAPLSFFVNTDTGDLINRFSQDMTLIDQQLPSALYTTSGGLLSCLAEAGLIFAGAKYFAIILPIALLVLYTLQTFYLRTSRQMRHLDLQAKAPLYTALLEAVDGLATIRAFGWRSQFRAAALEKLDASQRPYYLMFCIQRWLALVLDLIVAASAVLLVTFGVLMRGSTSASGIGLSMYAIVNFNQSLAGLIQSWTELETSLGAIARLRTFEEVTPSEEAADDARPNSEDDFSEAHWPSQGAIRITNLTVSYSTQSQSLVSTLDPSSEADAALKNISLNIKFGQKVAICGRTGSGKSTLVLALFRLLDSARGGGNIHIDDVDITRMPRSVLRSRLLVVPQEPLLFPGTLRSNLVLSHAAAGRHDGKDTRALPAGEVDDAQLIAALSSVALWPDPLGASSPRGLGLDADISEASALLSQGQKQLLCLARAIVQKQRQAQSFPGACPLTPPGGVLVLDEATSAVDQETERLMYHVLAKEFAGYTVVSVVHRLQSIVGNYDMVVVLDQGRVVDMGAPEDLLLVSKEKAQGQGGGWFRRMWDSEDI